MLGEYPTNIVEKHKEDPTKYEHADDVFKRILPDRRLSYVQSYYCDEPTCGIAVSRTIQGDWDSVVELESDKLQVTEKERKLLLDTASRLEIEDPEIGLWAVAEYF